MGGKTTPIITLINCLVNRKGFINSSKPVKFFVNYKVPTPHLAVLFQSSSAFPRRWLQTGEAERRKKR